MISRLLCVAPLPTAVAESATAQFSAILSQDKEMSNELFWTALHETPTLEAILTSARIKFDRTRIADLPPNIKILATCCVGTDHIDLDAARARKLIVTNTPDVLTNSTADLTFMLLLCAARRAREYVQIMDDGWRQRFSLADMLGLELNGKTLGIVGMGRIGRAVAQRARAFGMHVIYHNRHRLPSDLEQGAQFFPALRSMLPHCNFLSLNAPGGIETDCIIDSEALRLLPPGAILINTSRGQLIEENALIDALTSGHLAGAGLDVFRDEPAYDLRLRDLPNVFLTPHMGSATIETRNAMGMKCLENISLVLNGRDACDRVA
jgi:lactate dehydrogenase-like 2-hydroxyacid dehydrogenase